MILRESLTRRSDGELVEKCLSLLSENTSKLLIIADDSGEADAAERELGVKSAHMSAGEKKLFFYVKNLMAASALCGSLRRRGIGATFSNVLVPPGLRYITENDFINKNAVEELTKKYRIVVLCPLEYDGDPAERGIGIERGNPISGTEIVTDIAECIVYFCEHENLQQKRLDLLKKLAENRISLDMINFCYDTLHFIIDSKDLKQTERLLSSCRARILPDRLKLSVTGLGMKGTPGVMASIITALKKRGVPILRTTDSHTSISCLTEASYLPQCRNFAEEIEKGLQSGTARAKGNARLSPENIE